MSKRMHFRLTIFIRKNVSLVVYITIFFSSLLNFAVGYIPIWPLLRQMSAKKPAYGNTPIDQDEVEYDLWHPRCLGVADFATG